MRLEYGPIELEDASACIHLCLCIFGCDTRRERTFSLAGSLWDITGAFRNRQARPWMWSLATFWGQPVHSSAYFPVARVNFWISEVVEVVNIVALKSSSTKYHKALNIITILPQLSSPLHAWIMKITAAFDFCCHEYLKYEAIAVGGSFFKYNFCRCVKNIFLHLMSSVSFTRCYL